MATPKTISDSLRQAITESGLSLNALWKASGVDAGRLSRFLRGERGLTVDALDRLGQVLGLKLVYQGEGKPKKRKQVKK